jgi:hypothetical protein
MPPWHQAEPGGEMSCAFEQADAADRRRDQGGGDRADAGDRGRAARCLIVARVSDDLSFECQNAFSQGFALVGQPRERPPRFHRERLIRIHESR